MSLTLRQQAEQLGIIIRDWWDKRRIQQAIDERLGASPLPTEHIQFPFIVRGNFMLKIHDPARRDATFNIGIIHDSPNLHGKGGQFTFNKTQWDWFLALNKHIKIDKWWDKFIVNPNNAKFYMSRREDGRVYIPALGVFMGNDGRNNGNQVDIIGWYDKLVEIRGVDMSRLPQPEDVLKDPALWGLYNAFGGGKVNFPGGGIIIPNILPASSRAFIAADLIDLQLS